MLLDDILGRFNALPEKEQSAVASLALKATADFKFVPNPGPQTEAFLSPADVLGYGGSGGAGKSSLSVGLAIQSHRRSLILRRKYADLGGLIDEAIKLNGGRDGFTGSPRPRLVTKDGRTINFGAAQHPGDEMSWQGNPHDLLVVDETTQFLEQQIRFLLGWVRTDIEGQRCRVVLPTNPPLTAEGQWYIGFFKPWLDQNHPNPAKFGELRWFVSDPDGKDFEVDGPGPYQFPGADKVLIPKSRTFIRARLSDNPYLVRTGYQSTLDALPEPLRSAIRDGNFAASQRDAEWQLIPTAWIDAAMARWSPQPTNGLAMTAQAIDCAGGGTDSAVLASRHGGWYAPLEAWNGPETADPFAVVGRIVARRRDNCPVIVDLGGGYGLGVQAALKQNGIEVGRFNGADASRNKTRDGKLSFVNKRAEAWWRFREELDPSQDGGSVIALPNDPELRADLASATWEMTTRGIKVEAKDDIKKRLGRSPDKGDAVVMCLSEGTAIAARLRRSAVSPGGLVRTPKINVGYSNMKKAR